MLNLAERFGAFLDERTPMAAQPTGTDAVTADVFLVHSCFSAIF